MKTIIEFFRNLFASAAVVAANTAVSTLEANNARVAQAEELLASLKEQRVADAKANAVALEAALAAAASDAERNEIRRNAEVEAQNNKTDKTIAALEAAIANARRLNDVKLGKIAAQHNDERATEQADVKTATDALELVRAAAGTSAE